MYWPKHKFIKRKKQKKIVYKFNIGLNINLLKEKNRKKLYINLTLVIKLEFHIDVVLLNKHIMLNGVLKFLKFKGDIEGKINQYIK